MTRTLKGVREKYEPYVKDLLALADTPTQPAPRKKIFALETRFAKAHWTRVQNRDAEKTYNRYDRAALAKLMPAFDWRRVPRGARCPREKVPAVIVTQPSYFEALDKAVAEVPVEDWRIYFRYKLLHAYAPDLPQRVRAAAFRVQRPHGVGHRGAQAALEARRRHGRERARRSRSARSTSSVTSSRKRSSAWTRWSAI